MLGHRYSRRYHSGGGGVGGTADVQHLANKPQQQINHKHDSRTPPDPPPDGAGGWGSGSDGGGTSDWRDGGGGGADGSETSDCGGASMSSCMKSRGPGKFCCRQFQGNEVYNGKETKYFLET